MVKRIRETMFALGIAATMTTSPALAEKSAPAAMEPPAAFRAVLDCRTVTDPTQRLACYDAKVAALDGATQSNEIVVTDRARLQEARRGLFGFAAPIGKMLGIGNGGGSEADEIKQIDTTVTDVRGSKGGGWKLTFAEGGTWEQTDTKSFPMTPKVGRKARISRGALGSYFIEVDGMSGIKFRRVE